MRRRRPTQRPKTNMREKKTDFMTINLGGNDDPLGSRVACYIGGKAPQWRVHVGHVDVLEYYSIQHTCQGLITSNTPP
jgi:hypothetical protein